MVEVALYALGETGQHRFASVRVDGRDVQLDGDHERVEEIIAPDLRSDGIVRFEDDREHWARFLPAALRGAYLTATCPQQQFPTSPAVEALDDALDPPS